MRYCSGWGALYSRDLQSGRDAMPASQDSNRRLAYAMTAQHSPHPFPHVPSSPRTGGFHRTSESLRGGGAKSKTLVVFRSVGIGGYCWKDLTRSIVGFRSLSVDSLSENMRGFYFPNTLIISAQFQRLGETLRRISDCVSFFAVVFRLGFHCRLPGVRFL